MKQSFRLLIVAFVLFLSSAMAQVNDLTIWWAEWDPANYLQQLVNDYEADTGIKVNVVQEPWGSYYDKVAAEWAAKGGGFDLVVGDSQWIGQGVTEGHYVNLTDFMNENNITDTVTEATLKYYGEYPGGSGQYYAYPTEGDANGWAYRKDLFENPDEMAAFKEKYGYDLAVPETWAQLRDIAEFFTRPDDGLYGVGVYTQVDYDAITMGFENVFFSYGADWKDADNNVIGVVNSDAAVQALELYKELYDFSPPGTTNAFFAEMNDLFINGQAAMIMNYFAFFPALDNSEINKYRDVTGYFPMPKGPTGERYAALGGQGISVNSYASDERKQAALDFIKWFAQKDVQANWAALGGYTCNKEVLQSDAFLTQTPYNAAFAETMNFVKDFWNIPEFGQLLEPSQRYLHSYVVGGEGTAQEAMDGMAFEMDEILINAGVIKE
ncbi:MAG: sugar ABC transporter substrate-binding protein [Trueperaceae bacterium]|nr:sugar ABC transporter substrate-binding protein [Trueperaceae bacterium]